MKIFITCFAALILFSCGSRDQDSGGMEKEAAPQSMMISQSEDQSSPASDVVTTERKLIRNGSLMLEVEDVKKTKTEVDKIAAEFSAYTSSEDQNNFGDRLQYNQVIRVPAGRFDELVTRIESLALKVENKNISSQDVTEEFIDVEARLKTKHELEVRYREILKQAKTVSDIVSIESQIASVRGEIESMQGRLNYLKSQVSLSTLTVTYYEKIGSDFGFSSKLKQSFSNGWDNLLSFFIGLIDVWPFLLLIAIAVWLFVRRRKKRQPDM